MKLRNIIFIVLMIILTAGPAAAGKWPHERDGFMLGFNLGGGSASVKSDDSESESDGGVAGSFRLGWAFSNQFLVGLESTAWIGSYESGDLTLSSYKLNFTWYPGATGWFARAGFGGGTAELSTDLLGPNVSVSESGGSFGVGGGHEWRLTRTFALGAAIDYSMIDLDHLDYDFVNFTAQLNWYF